MSTLFRLDKYDALRGLVVAVLVAVLTLITELLKNKGLALSVADWQQVGQIAITAALGYLAKNFLTDNSGKLGGKLKVK